MTSGELGCVQRPEKASAPHRIIIHDDPHLFPRTADNPHRPGAFFDDRDRHFAQAQPAELPRGIYYSPSHTSQPPSHIWDTGGDTGSDDEDGEADGFVGANAKHTSSGSVQSSFDGARENDGVDRRDQMGGYENAIAVVVPDSYCPQVCHGAGVAQKEVGVDNGYGFRGRDPEESLRAHLSDPITGVLMDDAVILRCGHSYSSSGMQHIYRMKACYKCTQPISEDSARPNLSLRYAVQAFRREEESRSSRASKRKRERLEQDKCGYDEPCTMDTRGKGVQFPFVVADRVMIKGNKRTPERFVGLTHSPCGNSIGRTDDTHTLEKKNHGGGFGISMRKKWYVVKTLDNAESVKVQYRSLAKVTEDSSSNTLTNKSLSSNWL